MELTGVPFPGASRTPATPVPAANPMFMATVQSVVQAFLPMARLEVATYKRTVKRRRVAPGFDAMSVDWTKKSRLPHEYLARYHMRRYDSLHGYFHRYRPAATVQVFTLQGVRQPPA